MNNDPYARLISEPEGVKWFWWVLFVVILWPLSPITLPWIVFVDQMKKNRAAMYYAVKIVAIEESQ